MKAIKKTSINIKQRIMNKSDYISRKCSGAVALMSKISKDLCKVEEIVSDIKFYFETHNDGVWKGGTFRSLYEGVYELDQCLQSIKKL